MSWSQGTMEHVVLVTAKDETERRKENAQKFMSLELIDLPHPSVFHKRDCSLFFRATTRQCNVMKSIVVRSLYQQSPTIHPYLPELPSYHPQNSVKCNVDVAFLSVLNKSEWGMRIRDHEGKFLKAKFLHENDCMEVPHREEQGILSRID
ncbi:hypothetical protein VNO78_03316 [Psophocarpus tetragonolobus]|uniref:Uncharacterized protein n=1 Tax=Psophocarpus tetragonolobus TaxID=3891 RepID=A0AAN9XW03_PSOTE